MLIKEAQWYGDKRPCGYPKEVDEIIEDICEIIANAINISLHPAITIEDLNKYH